MENVKGPGDAKEGIVQGTIGGPPEGPAAVQAEPQEAPEREIPAPGAAPGDEYLSPDDEGRPRYPIARTTAEFRALPPEEMLRQGMEAIHAIMPAVRAGAGLYLQVRDWMDDLGLLKDQHTDPAGYIIGHALAERVIRRARREQRSPGLDLEGAKALVREEIDAAVEGFFEMTWRGGEHSGGDWVFGSSAVVGYEVSERLGMVRDRLRRPQDGRRAPPRADHQHAAVRLLRGEYGMTPDDPHFAGAMRAALGNDAGGTVDRAVWISMPQRSPWQVIDRRAPASWEARDILMRYRIDEFLGPASVALARELGGDAEIGPRIAAYVVFHLNPADREEAVERAGGIVAIRDRLMRHLRRAGMTDEGLIRDLVEAPLTQDLLENDRSFHWGRAHRLLVASLQAKLDAADTPPALRQELEPVLRALEKRARGFSGGPSTAGGGAAPAGGASPEAGGSGAGPAPPAPAGGETRSAKRAGAPSAFGGLVMVDDAASPPSNEAMDDSAPRGGMVLDGAGLLIGGEALPIPAVAPTISTTAPAF